MFLKKNQKNLKLNQLLQWIYKVKIKGYLVNIEVTWFKPALKCNQEHPEFRFEDEEMEFEWKAVSDNELLNMILEEDFYTDIYNSLYKHLEKLGDGK